MKKKGEREIFHLEEKINFRRQGYLPLCLFQLEQVPRIKFSYKSPYAGSPPPPPSPQTQWEVKLENEKENH